MNSYKTQDTPSSEGITRRKVLIAGGSTLVGATLLGSVLETAFGQTKDSQEMQRRGITSKDGGMKPTFLPEAGSTDAVAHSVADNLFWNEQMMEHAKSFVMLMPGPELAGPRRQAEQVQQTFAGQLEKARTANLDQGNYKDFNRSTIELIKPCVTLKHKMREDQAAGRLQSPVWASFFGHTAHEAERFA